MARLAFTRGSRHAVNIRGHLTRDIGMRPHVLAASVVLVLAVAAAPETARAQAKTAPEALDTSAVSQEMIDHGRSVFQTKAPCATCHGSSLEGTAVAPPLRPHAWRDAKSGSLDEIYRVITHGVPGTAMVAFPGGITDAEARALAAYIWAVDKGKAKP